MKLEHFKPSLLLTALLSASGAVSAATEPNLDFWLWLSGLPNWLLAALVAIPFVVLASFGLSLYHRTTGQGRGLVDYATLSGALVAGLLVALMAADPWNDYLSDKLTALPPTARSGLRAGSGTRRVTTDAGEAGSNSGNTQALLPLCSIAPGMAPDLASL